MGDFNARTGGEQEMMEHLVPHLQPQWLDCPLRRSNDSTVNSAGNHLLGLCCRSNLRIVNGRAPGDVPARPTSYGSRQESTSVVDYFLACPDVWSKVTGLTVIQVPLRDNSRDHDALLMEMCWFQDREEDHQGGDSRTYWYDWMVQPGTEGANMKRYSDYMAKPHIVAQSLGFVETIQACETLEQLEKVVIEWEHLVLRAVKYAEGRVLGTRRKQKNPRKPGTRGPRRRPLSELRGYARRVYRKEAKVRRKMEKKARRQRMEEAFFQDPRHFYANLRKQAKAHASVPLDSLTEYTKNNLRDDHSWKPAKAIDQSTGEWSYYWDYGFIQESEVEAALQATPNNVSVVGFLTPALMKRARQVMVPVVTAVLNRAVHGFECLPHRWAVSAITAVPKDTIRSVDPSRYRGIAVGTLPAKLLAKVVDARMQLWAEEGRRARGQFGFRKQLGCQHPMLVLRTLMDRYKAESQPLYACFVDFQRAYDSVPRDKLFDTLKRKGLNGFNFSAVNALYRSCPTVVQSKAGAGEEFETTKGVRQGCPLSPLLFGLYIDELESLLSEQEGCDFVTVGMLILYCLLYADDVLLLSSSTEGLQAQLDTVVRFGRDKGLGLNSDKSKVLRLGKPPTRKDNDLVISVEGKALEVVDIFKYLGTHVTEDGVNKKTLERRFQDGMAACMTMVHQSDRSGLRHPVVRCGIFKSLVLPVLSYGVECWGPMVLQRDLYGEDNQAETIWKRYLKAMLGLPTSVSGPSVLAEVGQYPVSFHWVRQVLRFFNTVLLSPEDTLVHQALMDNLALYCKTQDQCRPTRSGAVHNGSQCWIGDVFKMLDQLGVNTRDRTLPRQVDIKTVLQKWVNEYTRRVSSEASRAREGRQARYFALR
jgi:hypothetical protein